MFHSRIKKHGFSAMTFKIVTRRSDKSHWTDVKADRIHVAAEMYQHIHVEHKVVVFIDETHWTIGRQNNRGHSPKGEKAFTNRMLQRTPFTALSAITTCGHSYAVVAKGSVTSDIFKGFINKLLEWFVGAHGQEQGVFYMDNAPIHRPTELKRLFGQTNHILMFAPPYSAEMNPIEFMFGIWKRKADKKLKKEATLREPIIISAIVDSFKEITPQIIRNLIPHVIEKVYPKVFNGDTI